MTEPAPATTSTVAGLEVTRRRHDVPDAASPTVVLVHGAMDRAASFGRTMRRTGALDVVAYDRRGYAGSLGAGSTATIQDHADDLAAIIEWTDAPAVVVVGHSLGGTVAAALAVRGHPRLGAVAAYESPFPLLDDSFDQVGGGAVQVGRDQGPQHGAEHFYRLMVGDSTWSRLRERDRLARRGEGPALMAELEDLQRPDRAVDPALIRIPVLVGWGDLSSERMRSGAQLLVRRVPDAAVHEIRNAGHGAHLTHPDEFARFVATAASLAEPSPARPATPTRATEPTSIVRGGAVGSAAAPGSEDSLR